MTITLAFLRHAARVVSCTIVVLAGILVATPAPADSSLLVDPKAAISRATRNDPPGVVRYVASQITAGHKVIRWDGKVRVAVVMGGSSSIKMSIDEMPNDIVNLMTRISLLTGLEIIFTEPSENWDLKLSLFWPYEDGRHTGPEPVNTSRFIELPKRRDGRTAIGELIDPGTGLHYIDLTCSGDIKVVDNIIQQARLRISAEIHEDPQQRLACLDSILTEAMGATRWYRNMDIGRFIPQSFRLRLLYHQNIRVGMTVEDVEKALEEILREFPESLMVGID